MAITRSKAKQTHLEDFPDSKPPAAATAAKGSATKAKQAPKRKTTTSADADGRAVPAKRSRTAKAQSTEKDNGHEGGTAKTPGKASANSDELPAEESREDAGSVIINRAPVLHLYAACITHLVYPSMEWSTCLSAGAAVSALCAVAKGRSIGMISEPEEPDKDKKKSRDGKAEEQLQVMQFKLRRNKEGLAVVGNAAKKADEAALKRKFGDDQYDAVRELFEKSLGTWKGEEQELNKKAFGFYEQFRPNVAKGQSGWGRKGELRFDAVRKTVTKP